MCGREIVKAGQGITLVTSNEDMGEDLGLLIMN